MSEPARVLKRALRATSAAPKGSQQVVGEAIRSLESVYATQALLAGRAASEARGALLHSHLRTT